MPKHRFNLKFVDDELRCACLFGHPRCQKFWTCEVQELNYNPFEGVESCMEARVYKRAPSGAMKEIK